MTDIEQARTILTKWGEGVTAGPWEAHPYDGTGMMKRKLYARNEYDLLTSLGDYLMPSNATLIVAMTDPALREALDALLAHVINYPGWTSGHMRTYAERIAAAIIAIDQRMNA